MCLDATKNATLRVQKSIKEGKNVFYKVLMVDYDGDYESFKKENIRLISPYQYTEYLPGIKKANGTTTNTKNVLKTFRNPYVSRHVVAKGIHVFNTYKTASQAISYGFFYTGNGMLLVVPVIINEKDFVASGGWGGTQGDGSVFKKVRIMKSDYDKAIKKAKVYLEKDS